MSEKNPPKSPNTNNASTNTNNARVNAQAARVNAKAAKPPAVSHMLMFFVIPCVGFIIWASWSLVGALMEEKPQDIPSRIEAVAQARSSGDRWQAVYALSQELQKMRASGEWDEAMTPEQKTQLFETLTNLQGEHQADFRFRKYVLLTLGQFADQSVLPHVEKSLNEADEETRFFAAWAYLELLSRADAELKDEKTMVVESWLADEDPAFRKIAATYLVQNQAKEDYGKIRKLLDDPNTEVRWNTAVALASVGDDTAAKTLIEMFNIQNIRKLDVRSVDDLKQLLAAAQEAAEKLQSDEVFEARTALLDSVSADTPEGAIVHEALGSFDPGT